jgi:hypothetical protein
MVRVLALWACLLTGCDTAAGVVLVLDAADALDASAAPDAVAAAEAGSIDVDASSAEPRDVTDGSTAPVEPLADASATSIRSACRTAGAASGWFEEFAGETLDGTRFLLAHGHAALAGRTPAGGFVRDNVELRDGAVVLRVRGDTYAGPVRGIDATGAARADGRRSAAAIATRDLFASATYSVTVTLRGPPGVELVMFVAPDGVAAERLEIASPELSDGVRPARAILRSARADGAGGQSELALGANDDGRALHSLRFDWYTHAPETVRFWSDDVAHTDRAQRAPEGRAGRLWIVAWIPDDIAAPFDTVELRVERSFITPFGNSGDRCTELAAPDLLQRPESGAP